jgi:hypothetical protein
MATEHDYWNEMYSAAWDERKAVDRMIDANDLRLTLAREMLRPSRIWKPQIYRDGNAWCCNLDPCIEIARGVVAFGDTPEEATVNFDIAWLNGPIR